MSEWQPFLESQGTYIALPYFSSSFGFICIINENWYTLNNNGVSVLKNDVMIIFCFDKNVNLIIVSL